MRGLPVCSKPQEDKMADWEEIKRLAADFQRVQITSTAHKLSERNCVEIVQKLISLKLIEVIYTTDGKEYLTPQQLEKEIKDELFIHGGRINLVDIQQAINVDLSHIENKVGEILRHDKNLILIQGELIEREYLDRVAEEINETLQESGQVFVSEFSKTFTLPTDFVLEVVESRLGSIIQGQLDQMDRNVLFTHAFVARQTARIRGVLTAITRPTQLSSLIGQYGFQEELFYSVIGDLLSSQRIVGSTQGRQDKVSFVPDIYTQTQNKWVDDFFKQNGYIEYDALTRMGISDGKQFLKKRYRGNELFLPTCCVGQLVQDHVHAAIDEGLATIGWIDVTPLLPTPFTSEDANHFLQHYLKTTGRTTAQILCDSYVASESFIDACREPFDKLMQKKAEKDAVESPALLSELSKRDMANLKGGANAVNRRETKREERRKTASSGSKGGGGTGGRGGRETKTKKVKDKRVKGGKSEDPDDNEYPDRNTNPEELQFMNIEEITKILQDKNPDCDEEFMTEVAEQLYRPLTRSYQQVVRTVFQSSGDKKRKSHSEVQEKVNTLINSAKLFDKGIKLFDDDVQVHLSRHLLRTVCTDIVNLIVNMLAADHMLAVTDESSLSPENRMKIISKMPEQVKSPLAKLNTSLNAKETSDFFNHFEVVSGPDLCEFMIKKLDKKREKQLTIEHRAALQEQLRQEDEPAMALHLAAVLLYQHFTSAPIHAPGRCVPQIISSLASHLTPEQHETLTRYQSLVVKRLTGGPVTDESEPGEEEAGEKSAAALLEEKLQEIKDMALNIKKSNNKEEK